MAIGLVRSAGKALCLRIPLGLKTSRHRSQNLGKSTFAY